MKRWAARSFPALSCRLLRLRARSFKQRARGELRQRLLEAISEGSAKATVALLEQSARWDLDAVALRAVETADAARLNGKKLFVSDAEVADYIFVAARIGSELAVVVVDKNAQGLAVNAMPRDRRHAPVVRSIV